MNAERELKKILKGIPWKQVDRVKIDWKQVDVGGDAHNPLHGDKLEYRRVYIAVPVVEIIMKDIAIIA